MKKHLFVALTIASALLLTACGSGISQDQYDALASENTSLKAEVESLSAEIDSLSAENQSLSDKVQEQLDERTTQIVDDLPDSYMTSWAQASFGDNTICLLDPDKKYFQCIAGNTYKISKDGISKLWDALISSVKLLGLIDNSVPYEIVTVGFCDPSGERIFDIILNITDRSSPSTRILFNYDYIDIIVPIFDEIAKDNT